MTLLRIDLHCVEDVVQINLKLFNLGIVLYVVGDIVFRSSKVS